MKVGVVDIGTNSTRMLVASFVSHDPFRYDTLARKTRITRLGEGVQLFRRLSEHAVERTLETIASYADEMAALSVDSVWAFATSACRLARNRLEFFDRVHSLLGVRPVLLAGRTEAKLAFLGAAAGLEADSSVGAGPGPGDCEGGDPKKADSILVADIGGGSTELSLGKLSRTGQWPSSESEAGFAGAEGRDSLGSEECLKDIDFPGLELHGWASLELGCVRLTESFLRADPPRAAELSEALRHVDSQLVMAERTVSVTRAQEFVGLAGTVTSLAALDLRLARYDPDAVHRHRLSAEAVEALLRYFASVSRQELRQEPALEPERADVIVGGTVILAAMLRRWRFRHVTVSEADILDGAAMSVAAGVLCPQGEG